MPGPVLHVDPIACAGHGVCADLFPEWIRLDDWGFPIVDPRPIPADRLADAHWAADNCPALALKLQALQLQVGRGRTAPEVRSTVVP